jgi:hypothetical protein
MANLKYQIYKKINKICCFFFSFFSFSFLLFLFIFFFLSFFLYSLSVLCGLIYLFILFVFCLFFVCLTSYFIISLSCVSMVWLLILSVATTNADSWKLCSNERIHKALCRSWSTSDFKWFPTNLQVAIVR